MNPNLYVVMGVTGSGKSTVGATLAHSLGVDFVEGDDYHPIENVRRMASGIPLTDEDRADWLMTLAELIRKAKDSNKGIVLACSALKLSYRDVLRGAAPELRFVFLKGSESLIAKRVAARRGHFMPASLLESQLSILEEPAADEDVWTCDVNETAQAMVSSLMLRASA